MAAQVAYGKGFEFHLATEMQNYLDVPIIRNTAFESAERASLVMAEIMPKKQRDAMLDTIPSLVVDISKKHVPSYVEMISFNNDQCGARGIKADFNLMHSTEEFPAVGISCKHNSYETSSYQCTFDSKISGLTGLPLIDLDEYENCWEHLVNLPASEINWRDYDGRHSIARGVRDSEYKNLLYHLDRDRKQTIAHLSQLACGVASNEVKVSMFFPTNASQYSYDITKTSGIKEVVDTQKWENKNPKYMSKSIKIKVIKDDDSEKLVTIRYKNGDTKAKSKGQVSRIKPAITEKTEKKKKA